MDFVGILAAFLSGIMGSLGLGGGTVLLLYLINYVGFSQLSSQGINLFCFIPTALLAAVVYTKNKLINPKELIAPLLWAVFGSVLGFLLLKRLPEEILRRLFGMFLVFLALKELFSKGK